MRIALWLGLLAIGGQAHADYYCEPTDRVFLNSKVIVVGDVIEYHSQLGPQPFQVEMYGFATIKVVDALRGGDGGEVSVFIHSLVYDNGNSQLMDLEPGQRMIFGLQAPPSDFYSEMANGAKYMLFGYDLGPVSSRRGPCYGPVVEATDANIEIVRNAIFGVPFRYKEDDPPDESSANTDNGTCSVKQRAGSNWSWVTVPCP